MYVLNEWLKEWMNERMNERMNKWRNKREGINGGRKGRWIDGQINGWLDEWMNELINTYVSEWVSEGVSELMNDWMNEWTNKHWYTIKTKQGKHTSCSWILCSDNCDETACSSVELLVCITWPAGGIFPWSAAGKVTVTDTTVMLTLRLGILPARSCFSINSS